MGLGDVFGLDRVYDNQLQNYTNYSSETISSYGYIVGGITPASVSNVERVDFSTDTILDPGSRNVINGYAGSSGTKNVGDGIDNYVYGGLPNTNNTRVTRFSYSNETFQNTSTNLGLVHFYQGLTSNSQYAFIGGGQSPPQSPPNSNVIYRMNFSTETISTPGNNLPSGVRGVFGFSNSSFGFYANGFDAANTCSIYRLNFSNETLDASAYAHTQKASGYSYGVSTPEYAYIAGGYSGTDSDNISSIQRYDFSASTTSILPTEVETQTDKESSSSIESSTTGYFGGGYQRSNTPIASGDKLDFGTETISNLQNLASGRGYYHATFTGGTKITRGTPNFENWNESATYGYVMLGTEGPGGGDSSSVFRIDHSNETTSLPTAKQSITARAKNSRMQDNQYGFNFGGQGSPPTTYFSQFDRLDFLSETLSRLTNIPVADNSITSIDNDDIGYFIGGSSSTSPVPSSNYHRFDFKTDNVSYSKPSAVFNSIGSRGSLTFEDPSLRYGYVQGSYRPGVPQSLVARMEFSTETEVLSTPLLDKLAYGATAASKYHGYVISGFNSPSSNTNQTRKFEWATETYGTIADTIAEKRRLHSASQTGDSAWVMGGYKDNSPAGYTCTVERIDFETDTYSSPGNNFSIYLSQGSSHQGGSSLRQVGRNNRNDSRAGLDNQGRNVGSSYGYSIGASPNRYEVDRFDFLNETYNQINGPTTPAPFGNSSQGNTVTTKSFGYYSAHQVPGTPIASRSIVARLDFTNDSWIDTSSILTQNRHRTGCSYNHNYGYFAGGFIYEPSPGTSSVIDRIDFQSESVNVLTATLSQSRERLNTGRLQDNTLSYGYFIGGYAFLCTVDRLDMTTESASASTGAPYGLHFCNSYSYDQANLGYWTNGTTPAGNFSNIFKFDFTSETHTDTGNNSLPDGYGRNDTQNDNYGYGHLGNGTSKTARLDFSTETESNPGATASTIGTAGSGMSN